MRLYEVEYIYDKIPMGTDLFADFNRMVGYINNWVDKMGYVSPNDNYAWDKDLTLTEFNRRLRHCSCTMFKLSDKETIFIKDIYTKDSELED